MRNILVWVRFAIYIPIETEYQIWNEPIDFWKLTIECIAHTYEWVQAREKQLLNILKCSKVNVFDFSAYMRNITYNGYLNFLAFFIFVRTVYWTLCAATNNVRQRNWICNKRVRHVFQMMLPAYLWIFVYVCVREHIWLLFITENEQRACQYISL